MATSESSAETPTTVEEVVAQLAEMVGVSRANPTIAQRLLGQTLSVQYEFEAPDGSTRPYVMRVGGSRWDVEPGRMPPDSVDIVIGTSPDTLHRLTSGALGGREAVVSGLLDIRKAPSMPKLLLMRALFNRHKKARLRGEIEATTTAAAMAAAPQPPAAAGTAD
jgi:hypothetical protein